MASYRFLDEIGSGGFGVVYRGVRVDDQWPCALKRLKPGAAPEDRKRFEREVHIQAPLQHPNIVKVVAQDLQGSQPWFAMPLADLNLRKWFGETAPGPDRLWVIRQTAEGLAHAHANGVLHRDLKPENVLIFFDQRQKPYAAVSDFGLGRLILRDSPSLTVTGMRMGTVEYMAPEQYTDSKNVDVRADIYALGKMLYEALTGIIPYPTMDLSKLPSDFRYIVQKSCDPDPARRYLKATHLVADLDVVTLDTESLQRPVAAVKALVKKVGLRQAAPDALAKALVNNLDDNEVLMNVLPDMPPSVLGQLFAPSGAIMLQVMNRFDENLDEGVPFEYCDRVANFYERVLDLATGPEIRVLVLRRLPLLAHSHNRFYVGDVFARIVANLADKNDLLAVRDVLQENPDAAAWCRPYLEGGSLPPLIRRVLDAGS